MLELMGSRVPMHGPLPNAVYDAYDPDAQQALWLACSLRLAVLRTLNASGATDGYPISARAMGIYLDQAIGCPGPGAD